LDEPSENPILKGNRFNQAPGLMNAIRVLHAIGGSTNAVIHRLAIAYELGLEDRINLDLIESRGRETPCLTAVWRIGPYAMRYFEEAGGAQTVMKQITSKLDLEALDRDRGNSCGKSGPNQRRFVARKPFMSKPVTE